MMAAHLPGDTSVGAINISWTAIVKLVTLYIYEQKQALC